MKLNSRLGFTFVELIVVITIIAILGTIGFISYSGYISDSRDTSRISQASSMVKALESYRAKGFLPMPDRKVIIYASGAIVGYQGYIGEDVLNIIGYQDEGVDPKDGEYFTYYLTKDLRKAQIMTYLENDAELSYGIINKANAADYTDRFPRVFGAKLGILTENVTNIPIQENSTIVASGYLDIVKTNVSYTAIISNNYKITGTGSALYNINDSASCKRILESGGSRGDGTYIINPIGISLEVYCDMVTDGGGWTLVHKTTDNQTDLAGTLDTTEGSSDWNDNGEYRLSINYWKYLSTEKAMARNIRIDGKYWDDIEEGYITSISTSGITFSQTDKYAIFNTRTAQNDCTSFTYYWNGGCCSRCVNFDLGSTYGYPENAPMIITGSTSYNGSAVEGAGGTLLGDAQFHKLSKMGIFLK